MCYHCKEKKEKKKDNQWTGTKDNESKVAWMSKRSSNWKEQDSCQAWERGEGQQRFTFMRILKNVSDKLIKTTNFNWS